MRKKVLFTTNIPVPYRVAFFNELGKMVDLTVAFERSDAKTRNAEWLKNSFQNFTGVFMKGKQIGDDCAFCPEIVKIIHEGQFDDIIIGAYYTPTAILAIEYMRLHHIPFCFSGDGGFIKPDRKLKYVLKHHLQSGGKLYFSPSQQGDKVFLHYGAVPDRIRRYPFTSLTENDILPVAIAKEEKEQLRKKLNISEQKMVLGVGRLVDFKAWEYFPMLAKAFGPSVGVYLVGGKTKGSYYEKIFSQYELSNFHVLDFYPKAKLWEFYMAADVFVMPTRGDVWGLVVNEAMACGLPVVTTDKCVAGLQLVENQKNGYIVPADDFESLYDKTNHVLSEDSLRKAMSENNLRVIGGYTISSMAKQYARYLM